MLTVHGVYNPVPDTVAGVVADQWALWYTTDGSTPGTGSPAYTATMVFDRGFSHFSYDLPAQADGVVVKTLLKTRRVSGAAASENTTPQATTISTVGPDVPEDTVVIPIRR